MSYVKPSLAKRGNRRRPQRRPSRRQRHDEVNVQWPFRPGEALRVVPLAMEEGARVHAALAAMDTGELRLPASTSPETVASLGRGVALLDERAPGWQEKVSLEQEAAPADPREALIDEIRAYAREHYDDPGYAWDSVIEAWDRQQLEEVIGSRVKTLAGARKKIEPLIEGPRLGASLIPGMSPASAWA